MMSTSLFANGRAASWKPLIWLQKEHQKTIPGAQISVKQILDGRNRPDIKENSPFKFAKASFLTTISSGARTPS